jgi:hypothetical protein
MNFTLTYNNPKIFTIGQALTTGWWHRWSSLMDFIWLGLNSGNYLISSFIDHRKILITSRDFLGDFIPEGSIATFKLQDDADLILDDAPDHLWFDAAGNQNDVTAPDLYSIDYARTVIKYAHSSPYNITAIGLLKSGIILTPTQLDRIHSDFELWLFWSGFWNDYGYLKDNRLIP